MILDEATAFTAPENEDKIQSSIMDLSKWMRISPLFFTEQLIAAGVDPEVAEANACRIEHIISEESFERLKEAANGMRQA